jgi:hypothetical protein
VLVERRHPRVEQSEEGVALGVGPGAQLGVVEDPRHGLHAEVVAVRPGPTAGVADRVLEPRALVGFGVEGDDRADPTTVLSEGLRRGPRRQHLHLAHQTLGEGLPGRAVGVAELLVGQVEQDRHGTALGQPLEGIPHPRVLVLVERESRGVVAGGVEDQEQPSLGVHQSRRRSLQVIDVESAGLVEHPERLDRAASVVGEDLVRRPVVGAGQQRLPRLEEVGDALVESAGAARRRGRHAEPLELCALDEIVDHTVQESPRTADRRVGRSHLLRHRVQALVNRVDHGQLTLVVEQRTERSVEYVLASGGPGLGLGVEGEDRVVPGPLLAGGDQSGGVGDDVGAQGGPVRIGARPV